MEAIQDQESLKRQITDAGYLVPDEIPERAVLILWQDSGSVESRINSAIDNQAAIITDYYADELPTHLSPIQKEYFAHQAQLLQKREVIPSKDILIALPPDAFSKEVWLDQARILLQKQYDLKIDIHTIDPMDATTIELASEYKTLILIEFDEAWIRKSLPRLILLNSRIILPYQASLSQLRQSRLGGNFHFLETDKPSLLLKVLESEISSHGASTFASAPYDSKGFNTYLRKLESLSSDAFVEQGWSTHQHAAMLLYLSEQETLDPGLKESLVDILVESSVNYLKSKQDRMEVLRLVLKIIEISEAVQERLFNNTGKDQQELLAIRLLEGALISNLRLNDSLRAVLSKYSQYITQPVLNRKPNGLKILYAVLNYTGDNLQQIAIEALKANSREQEFTPILWNTCNHSDNQWLYRNVIHEFSVGFISSQNYQKVRVSAVQNNDFETLLKLAKAIVEQPTWELELKVKQLNFIVYQYVYFFYDNELDRSEEFRNLILEAIKANSAFNSDNDQIKTLRILVNALCGKLQLGRKNPNDFELLRAVPQFAIPISIGLYLKGYPEDCKTIISVLNPECLKFFEHLYALWIFQDLLGITDGADKTLKIIQCFDLKYFSENYFISNMLAFQSLVLRRAELNEKAKMYLEAAIRKMETPQNEFLIHMIPPKVELYTQLFESVCPDKEYILPKDLPLIPDADL